MPLDLADFEHKAREATKTFWLRREEARLRQVEAGRSDQGERAGVTAGKNMEGFAELLVDVVKANGLAGAEIHQRRAVVTLPGYFRPTKLWDLIVIFEGQLVAVVELKSQVGPSFGNNFNNRAEEAIGTAHDFWVAYREGAFGAHPRPFVGWLMLVEDASESRRPVTDRSPHFPVSREFQQASYVERYDLLCQRLILEQLYTAASVLVSPRSAMKTGQYGVVSELTGLRGFVAGLAGHVAGVGAQRSPV